MSKPRILIPCTDIKSSKSLEQLRACLKSLEGYCDFNITCVFDSCNNEFVEYFEKTFHINEVIRNTGNRLNFSRNVNLGLRRCREREETVFLLNQDTALRPEQGLELSKLCNWVGITNLKCCDDPKNIPEGTGEIVEVAPGDKVAFFGTIIHHSIIKEIGILDGAFKRGGCEDDDYQLRAKLAGFKVYVADRYLYHQGSYVDSSDPNWTSSSGSYNAADLGFNLNMLLTKWQCNQPHAEVQKWVLENHKWNSSMAID